MTDNFRERNLSVNSIDVLEHGGAGARPFSVRHDGYLIELPDPREMHYQGILTALYVGHVPWTPSDIPEWKRRLVFDRWCAAWDLPDFQSAQRLAYLVDHYRAAISHDLVTLASLDLGDLWRARRWTLLLDVIDRLPAHSQYASTASMDEEHAEMLAESLAARVESGEDDERSGPSLAGWTPEVAALTNIFDAVRSLQHTLVAVNSEKGKAPEAPKPSARPNTPLEAAIKRARAAHRKTAHDALVARVLPNKRRSADTVD